VTTFAALTGVEVGSRAATIMFGDVEGFTPLTERLGDRAAADILLDLDAVVRAALDAHGGHRTISAGDGFTAVFADPADGLRAATEVQRALAGAAARMRIGVHTGPVLRLRAADGASDVVGRSVIVASRICDAARGGQVLVSSAVRRPTETLDEFRFRRRRRLLLKGLAGRYEVVELAWKANDRRKL
jgi:adenylate cyclase